MSNVLNVKVSTTFIGIVKALLKNADREKIVTSAAIGRK